MENTTTQVTTTQAKRGRKAKDHKCSWNGKTVNGLYRKSERVWRIRETGQEFTEPDERRAVERFRKWEAENCRNMAILDQEYASAHDLPVEDLSRQEIIIDVPADGGPIIAGRAIPEAEIWAWVTQMILKRPQYAAQMTGIEQLAWLGDLKRPTASMQLSELGDLYANKPGLSSNEASRSKLFWKEFCKAVGITTVREIDHAAAERYEAKVRAGNYSPKSILHRFRKVRTVLAYAIKRGKAPEDCRKALDVLAMLEVKDVHTLDPKPIKVADFWAIHQAALDAEDKTFAALMLAALNCAMYGGEAGALKWEEIDIKAGELVTRRPKTQVSRVAILWPETIKALNELPRQGEHVFYTRVRSYTTYSVTDAFAKYRTAAGIGEDVTFGMIRDAGYSIACREANIDQARVLAGHRLPGQADHYVRRNPGFVREACEAIRREFYTAGKAKPRKAKDNSPA